jgi:two-component system cell cycle response regulator
MALRVLLADESTTIKKVFQLALQDFAAEVTAVNVGLDVEQVALKIKPDIIFADVLLQKKNGYEVCRDIKNNPQLAHVPVVLVWSGFMELDKNKFSTSGADAHLEKPFDTAKLRHLVQSLVQKTKTQPLSEFLTFPKLPDFAETRVAPPPPSQVAAPPPARAANPPPARVSTPPPAPFTKPPQPPAQTGSWSMESFEKIDDVEPMAMAEDEEFVAVELPAEPRLQNSVRKNIAADEGAENNAEWVQKTLSHYKIDPSKRQEEAPSVKYKVPQENIETDSFVGQLDLGGSSPRIKPQETAQALSPAQIESILRSQSTEIIEKIVWQVVPEIATRIIERELEKILKERSRR